MNYNINAIDLKALRRIKYSIKLLKTAEHKSVDKNDIHNTILYQI